MKGQAAVEYLTTYGWALLLLVIVLGAIVASGALTPTYLVSEECNLGPNLPCSFIAYKDEQKNTRIKLNITNGFAYKIYFSSFKIGHENGLDYTDPKDGTTPGVVESGSSVPMDFELLGSNTNQIDRFRVELTYNSCAPEVLPVGTGCGDIGALKHTINGKITARVISGN